MIPSPNPEPYIFPLPQYGFGADIDYKTLVSSNPFLYRVYTPKERSPFADVTDPWFVAGKFDEVYARTPATITSSVAVDPLEASYNDVAAYMEWTTRSKSIFVSASFNFAWSIWEAVRRYHHGMKKDVEIAIIDASALLGRAATGVELLKKSSPEERNSQHSKWYRFSQESQSALIHGFIPGYAVLASIPLSAILERLPSYYLRSKTLPTPGKPLDHLGWNYADKKLNYRQFCQEISNRFFAQSQEMRFRDATGGSMRLALTLLRPWFHKMVTQDFRYATRGLRDLAIIIAHWGGQWWAKEHSELNRILDSMANTLGEEILQRFQSEDQEIHRLQDSVAALERVIRTQETKRLTMRRATDSMVRREYCSTPTTPEHSPKIRPRRTLSMSIHMPSREVANVHSPVTPPESPNYSSIFSRHIETDFLPSTITFQPFTPPVEWPSLPTPPRQLSVSTRSLSSNGTPPALRSILSPVPEVTSPMENEAISPAVDDARAFERPQTPTTPRRIHFQLPSAHYLPSPAATPPAILDSLKRDGLRARTISDLSQGPQGLRIDIPTAVPRQLTFSQSPVESGVQTTTWTACADTPAGLAPVTPPPEREAHSEEQREHEAGRGSTRTPLVKEKVEPSSLGSPILLAGKELPEEVETVAEEKDAIKVEELPPLPPSPAESWGSVTTLPPSLSREGTPEPKIRDSFMSDTTRIGSDGSPVLKAVADLRRSGSVDSLASVQSIPRRVSAIGFDEDEVEDENAKAHVSSESEDSEPTTPLSEYLPTPTDEKPQRGPFLQYRLPRAPTGIFNSPVDFNTAIGYDSDDEDSSRRRMGPRQQQKRPALAETGAFVVTGFLVGAFVTLFLVSTQRRAVLYLT